MKINLVNTSKKLYRDKSSEIGTKYFISRDIIYLYFDSFKVEMLVNDDLFTGDSHMLEDMQVALTEALDEKRAKMAKKYRDIPYKCYIFTNNIERAASILRCNEDEEVKLFYAQSGLKTRGKLFKVICRDLPFILVNMLGLCCNALERVEGEGVYKIQNVMDFNCELVNSDVHHIGQTIGRNIERMEGALIRDARSKYNMYFPKLFSRQSMNHTAWDGQLVRNYNLLQCCNMAGLIQLDEADTYKVIHNVISFDMKTAYMSVMINEPIFPSDLSVIDIDTSLQYTDYLGHIHPRTPEDVIGDIIRRLRKIKYKKKWFYITFDPNYSGEDEYTLNLIRSLKYFRRSFIKHKGVKLLHVNQEQIVCFTPWDIKFYNEYYKLYTKKEFAELLVELLTLCPEAKITLMYSKSPMDYLPDEFRAEKIRLYYLKEQYDKSGWRRECIKMYTELTYGKGLQLRNYQSDEQVVKAVLNETVNIAMSLTCCSYIRWRLVHDWRDFIPVYMDSDSVKFKFGAGSFNCLTDLLERYNELSALNQIKTALAGFNTNIGTWQIDGFYSSLLFLAKKCYIGYTNQGEKQVKLSGCLQEAYRAYFDGRAESCLDEIAAAKCLHIPKGKRNLEMLSNHEFQYYKYQDVIYRQGEPTL